MSKIITGKARMSYANVFEAKSIRGGDPKFSVSIIIPKDDITTINKIKAAIESAKKEGLVKLGGKIPANLKTPLRDGDLDRPDDEAYAGSFFVNANSTTRPGIVDENLNPIIDPTEFYSGCYGRASIVFYAYNVNGNKGIACGLQNLQKLADGESLAGKASAENDFGTDDILG